jgi:hypothetical protein
MDLTEFEAPDTPLFQVLVVEPAFYAPDRWEYVWRGLGGLTKTIVIAVDELAAFAKAQAHLDMLRKEQLGRRMKWETKDDHW